MNIVRNNHYVPGVYLKHFADAKGLTRMYRPLVSRQEIKEWKTTHVTAVGYHRDLYTRLALGVETDEFELWLSKEFETPADSVLTKVHNNDQLDPNDWIILAHFLACQIVRTPAYLMKMLPRWNQIIPLLLDQTIAEVDAALLWAKITGEQPVAATGCPTLRNFPLKVIREEAPEEEVVRFRTEITIGRGLWLSTMNMLLTHSIRNLANHHWSIFHAATGLDFFTSDDPVIRLNYKNDSNYDFNGGWGITGTEILLPLSPRHIMYTKIGVRCAPRGLLLTESETRHFRRMIAEHAHRAIFAANEDSEVPILRPRIANANLVTHERSQWQQWHQEQVEAETKVMPISQKPDSI